MLSEIYIHYGSKEFDESKFSPIKNHEIMSKPKGGLWGSPIKSSMGWKEWCGREQFRDCSEENSFQFTLCENANLLVINSTEDLNPLPKNELLPISAWIALDFEKMIKDGIDAIQVNISNDYDGRWGEGLYWKLYGWDCDSILVMNKDVVEIIEEDKE